MSEIFSAADAAAPEPDEFAAQLIDQLLADLNGLLFEGRNAVADAAMLLRRAAEAGAARGALWLLLVQASLNAYAGLIHGGGNAIVAAGDVDTVLVKLLPNTRTQLPALRAHADRLRQHVAFAERARQPAETAVERAIVRLYEGLGSDDETLSSRGLIELRSLAIYLDATACMIDTQPAASEPVGVVRPDRFHDFFLRFNELVQRPASAPGERAVATLSQDGRISAVITRDEHPLENAERELRAQIGGDPMLQDSSLLRIKALLAFIERLRRDPAGNALLGNPLDDATAHSSLIVAAATAPLLFGSEFGFQTMVQLAVFNQSLLRGSVQRMQ